MFNCKSLVEIGRGKEVILYVGRMSLAISVKIIFSIFPYAYIIDDKFFPKLINEGL